MTRHGGAKLLILAAIILAGCVPKEREYVMDTDECLKADKRAVMLCPKHGRCWIECREKAND